MRHNSYFSYLLKIIMFNVIQFIDRFWKEKKTCMSLSSFKNILGRISNEINIPNTSNKSNQWSQYDLYFKKKIRFTVLLAFLVSRFTPNVCVLRTRISRHSGHTVQGVKHFRRKWRGTGGRIWWFTAEFWPRSCRRSCLKTNTFILTCKQRLFCFSTI